MMPESARLLAWIEPRTDDEFLAAFVASTTPKRVPATRAFGSRDEAHRWVQQEATTLGVPVHWIGADGG